MYPDKKGCETQHIISELQDKKIQYQAQWTVNSVKGCFVGVRFKKPDCDFNREAVENLGEKYIDPEEYDKEVEKKLQFNIVPHLQKQLADQQEYIKKLEALVQHIQIEPNKL